MASLIKRFGITSLIIIALAVAKPTFVFANEKFSKRFKLVVEGRYLFMNREAQTYAELMDWNGNSAGTLEIEPDYTWTGKAGLGIQFTETFDIFASYSGLKSKGEDSYLLSYYTGSPWPLNLLSKNYRYYWNAATAEVETSYQVIDFEAGHTFKLGGSDIRLSAGVRYADFNQEVNTAFQYFAYVFNERRNVDTWGVGPRLGLNFKLPIFNSGLHLVGAAGGAVLFGKTESVTDEWIEGTNYYDQALYSDSRTFYSTEGELGLAFIGKMTSGGDISVVLGYRCEHWKDINYTQTRPSFFLGNSFGTDRADQFFHGPFVQIGISF